MDPMKAAARSLVNAPLAAVAVCALPPVAFGMAAMLDQSMRRPSLARLVLHSLQMVF